MKISQPELDRLRREHSELENHYIDELVAGRLSRREFIRRGSAIGIATPALGAILAACGSSSKPSSTGSKPPPVTRGGTLRVATQAPAGAVNPLTVADAGGLCMLQQTGEFLVLDNNLKLRLEPMLATSWKPNADASAWTFTLRPGVRFSDGRPMSADDVVYTFQQLADPKNASNALSTFEGVLSPAGVRKLDAGRVEFQLEAPVGSFPYLVSSDNYNAVIVPRGTDFSSWQSTFVGTGPFKLSSYTQNVGASFVPNPHYWGAKPLLSSTQFKFYASQQPQILALEGGDVDVLTQFVPAGASSLLHNSSYRVIVLRSANHRELSMRTDMAPFDDPRVRQAVAYSLNRPEMVRALLYGYGSVANDYPFAPRFPSTNTSVPQRTQDLAKARALLSAAGHPHGISSPLYTEVFEEIPQLAQVIAAQAAQAGITIKLSILPQPQYYGKATYGNSDWLDGEMSLVDYGDRGVPNVFLEAPLTSNGPWNAARFHDKSYDRLVKQFVAAVDLQTQRQIAGRIERLLLAQTPIVIPYWIDGLTATTPSVGGVNPTSISQLFLGRAYKS
jgi:peptide/nickel transport system substrate-binding protein